MSVIQDVTGKETSYVYDYENRLKSIEENGRVLAEYRYTPGGKVSSVACGAVVTSYEYDGAGNNTVITTAAGDARISRIRYGYDKRGNCIRREYEDFRGASGRIEYAYDGADRLILEKRSSGPVCSYAYDRAGNRVRMEQETGTDRLVTRYVYNDRNRLAELTRSGPQQEKVTFAYDPDGNMTGDGRGIYGYDEFDRMVSAVMENGDSLVCRYDAEGLRYETEENARLFSYIYHGRQVATETGEGSTTRYIRGNGRLTASDSKKARTYYHYVSDQQSSVRYVADSGIGKTDEAVESNDSTGAADIPLNERILNHYEYDAFGNLLEYEERVYNPFCYTGEQYDRTTQLYYLRARYYNPVIGRFMQQDTYLGDGLNLYAYVQNNPVRYVDPSGHCKQQCKDNGVEIPGKKKYTESQIKKIISNLQGSGFKNHPLRKEYENKVVGLKEYGERLLMSGMSEEQVARKLNEARRELGVIYKDATPQPLRDYIYELNIKRYHGDKLGPTYDYFKSRGKSDMEIINSSSKPNSDIDKLLSGFEDWLREQ